MYKKVLTGTVILLSCILGYGYWHASNYGWLYISVRDVSGQNPTYAMIKGAKIALLSSNGSRLAEGKSDERTGVVYLTHPDVGSCVEEEKKAPFSSEGRKSWDHCYEKQAQWIIEWARKVKYLEIKLNNCVLERIPVSVSESNDDWWLWWIPLPHIGGSPTTYFSLHVNVDSDKCEVKPL